MTHHRIPADTSTGAEGVLWIFSAIWFGMLAFIASVAPVDAGLLCPAIPGLLPLGIAFRTMRTRLRYGDAEFEMTAPAVVGGSLEGVLHLPRAAGDEDRIRATLLCKYRRGTGKPRVVLWRGVGFAGAAEPREPGRSRFPVRIDIPATCWRTGREGAFWSLVVSAEQGCPGLDVLFHVFVESAPEQNT